MTVGVKDVFVGVFFSSPVFTVPLFELEDSAKSNIALKLIWCLEAL